jgi:hypothetical protein
MDGGLPRQLCAAMGYVGDVTPKAMVHVYFQAICLQPRTSRKTLGLFRSPGAGEARRKPDRIPPPNVALARLRCTL